MFLGFLEILARRRGGLQDRPHIQMDFDADLMWGLTAQPGEEQRVNSLGLRGDEPGDGPRLLTLGDSSIYGHGVAIREVFSSIVAERLEMAAVIGGVPGYSSFQSRRLLERVGPRVEPRVVVIGNLWSDAFRAAVSDRAWSEELTRTYGPWQPLTRPLATLSQHSALAGALRGAVHDGLFAGRANEIGWSHLVEGEVHGRPPAASNAASLPTARVPLDEYVDNLHALATGARALGAEPVFLVLPHPLDATSGLPPDPLAYREAMRRVAFEEGAPLADAAERFADHPAEGRFSDDIHPSAAGHAAIADVVIAALDARTPR